MSILKDYPFFSIIIPTYNSGNNLEDALLSINKQGFTYYEVLIIDNLSSDNTIFIAEKFSKLLTSVKIVSRKDKGIYHAMNSGINLASGKWFYFMGSDDKLYNEYVLQKIYDQVKNNKEIEVIYGNVDSGYFNKLYDGKFSKWKISNKNICHQAIFLKKTVFSKIGVFNLDYKVLADWDHNIRWFFNRDIKQFYVDMIIANYGEGGFSSKHTDEKFHREKKFIILKEFLKRIKRFIK